MKVSKYLARYLADMVSIQSLMGHVDFSTTRRYLHAAEELKRKAVEQLPQLPYYEIVPQNGEKGAGCSVSP